LGRLCSLIGMQPFILGPLLSPNDTLKCLMPFECLLTNPHDPDLKTKVELLAKTPGLCIFIDAIAPELTSIGLTVEAVDHWNAQNCGAFRITAIPAVHWRCDDQTSWMVEIDGHNYFHGGLRGAIPNQKRKVIEVLTNQSLYYGSPLKNQKHLLPDIGQTKPSYLRQHVRAIALQELLSRGK
jgi:hypothetical protein